MAETNDDQTVLDGLHEALASVLLARINDPEAPASLLKEAREFLKDNGIQQPNPKKNSPAATLAEVLPFEEPAGTSHD